MIANNSFILPKQMTRATSAVGFYFDICPVLVTQLGSIVPITAWTP